jgi:RHS repeat-associated protein
LQEYTTGTNKYKFTEKERDAETSYDYFGARYYNNKLGVWLSADPMDEKYPGFSPFNYCVNNPLRLVDPVGMSFSDFTTVTSQANWNGNSNDEHYDDSPLSIGWGVHEGEKGDQKKNSSIFTYDQMKVLVKANNKSKLDDELIIAVAWNESNFDQSKKATGSSATGLMMLTKTALKELKRLDLGDFSYKDIQNDANYNIQAGSIYLEHRISLVKGNIINGLKGYGTGESYPAAQIKDCAENLKAHSEADPFKYLNCIHK